MKTRVWFLLLALLAACSGGDVILNIDILSFLTDSGTNTDAVTYAYDEPLIGALTLTGIQVVGPTEVQLVDAIDDLSVVQEGVIFYEIEGRNVSGNASATVRLRMGTSAAELTDAASVLATVTLDLTPANTSVASGSIPLDDVALSVFSGQQVWFSLDMDLSAAAQGPLDRLVGEIEVTELRARIVADEDFF